MTFQVKYNGIMIPEIFFGTLESGTLYDHEEQVNYDSIDVLHYQRNVPKARRNVYLGHDGQRIFIRDDNHVTCPKIPPAPLGLALPPPCHVYTVIMRNKEEI